MATLGSSITSDAARRQPALHAQTLVNDALDALAEGELPKSFAFIDRRCRLPQPRAEHFMLRAAVRRAMGDGKGAARDLILAAEIDPTLPELQKSLVDIYVASGQAEQAQKAARRIFRDATTPSGIAELAQHFGLGRERPVGGVLARGEDIVLWAACERAARLTVHLQADEAPPFSLDVALEPEALPGRWTHSAEITIGRDRAPRYLRMLRPDESIDVLQSVAIRRGVPPFPLPAHLPRERPGERVTVIVPVYGDPAATRACFASLLADETLRAMAQIVVINDASPFPEITQYLRELDAAGHIDLLENPFNLGFIGAVNRALTTYPTEDVVLLNADTVLPEGWLPRLQRAARSSPDVGTATPLSNNGDLVSFPGGNALATLPSLRDLTTIDRMASHLFRGQTLEVPTGVGFCLYIRKECLRAVGILDDNRFLRGYLEEVDFCLRARVAGFRNLCALDVYVGHAGSASFGDSKRAYVVHNVAELERRYPGHRREMEHFRARDPMRPVQLKLEEALTRSARFEPSTLLVSGSFGAEGPLVEKIAANLQGRGGSRPLILFLDERRRWTVRRHGGGLPHTLDVHEIMTETPEQLVGRLRKLGVVSLHVMDLADLPEVLVDLVISKEMISDLTVANASMLCPLGSACGPDGQLCECVGGAEAHCQCLEAGVATPSELGQWRVRREQCLLAARSVFAGSEAASLLSRMGLKRRLQPMPSRPFLVEGDTGRGRPLLRALQRVGVLVPDSSPAVFALLRDLGRNLRALNSGIELVVLGEVFDSFAAMAPGNILETGPVEPDELTNLLDLYGCIALFVATRGALFEHPIFEHASKLNLPTAGFALTGLRDRVSEGETLLLLPADATPAEIAAKLDQWLKFVEHPIS